MPKGVYQRTEDHMKIMLDNLRGVNKLKAYNLICHFCKKGFIKNYKAKYCSMNCYREDKSKIKSVCLGCGKEYRVSKGKIKKSKYCSRECLFKDKNIQLKCLKCGKGFISLKSSNRKYCSKKCYGLFGIGKIKKICVNCNKSFESYNKNRKYCSDECFRKCYKLTILTKNCEWCKKDFKTTSSKKKKKFCSRRCHFNWERSKKISTETLKKISKTWFKKGEHINPKTEFKKSNKSWNKGLTKENTPQLKKQSEEMKERRKKQILPTKDTSIEVKIQNFLKSLGIDFFTHQYMKEIEHGYQCDIFIPSMNLVIECDGDYWHKYPTGREIDHIRTSELIEKGFKVLRLWGFEIKKMDLNNFKERIK